jgi:hypothetical protein
MSRTISNSYSSGVTLTNAGDNPVLVTATIDAVAGDGLIGASPIAWSITNQGTVETSDAAAAAGISLASGGSIDNSGSIAGIARRGYRRRRRDAGQLRHNHQ